MPTRKPKRTNWKQEAKFYEQSAAKRMLHILWLDDKIIKITEQRDAAQGKVAAAQAQVEQLVGDIQAVSQDYTDAKKALDAAERHNAELLREREVRELANKTVCRGCFRHECHGECMTPVRFHDEVPEVMYSSTSDVIEDFGEAEPKPSWLRRNWVELTVMATVLGAIGFVVWRAWR